MKFRHRSLFFLFMSFFIALSAFATEKQELEAQPTPALASLSAKEAQWTFSGIAFSESGERYLYFFQIERHLDRIHGVATVLDGQSSEILIYEENNSLLTAPESNHWRVGNLFLRFNPINQSWIFGVKSKKKLGFNFKVDMLEQTQTSKAKKQILRQGVALLITQTGQLNGHLQLNEKEQFITAKKAWFRQIWASETLNSSHPLTGILCEFDNGAGFYSVNIPESDTLRGSVASWRTELGMPLSMSQFVTIEEDKQALWQIHLSSPKLNLSFLNLLNTINGTHQLIAGRLTGPMSGFCAITRDALA